MYPRGPPRLALVRKLTRRERSDAAMSPADSARSRSLDSWGETGLPIAAPSGSRGGVLRLMRSTALIELISTRSVCLGGDGAGGFFLGEGWGGDRGLEGESASSTLAGARQRVVAGMVAGTVSLKI